MDNSFKNSLDINQILSFFKNKNWKADIIDDTGIETGFEYEEEYFPMEVRIDDQFLYIILYLFPDKPLHQDTNFEELLQINSIVTLVKLLITPGQFLAASIELLLSTVTYDHFIDLIDVLLDFIPTFYNDLSAAVILVEGDVEDN